MCVVANEDYSVAGVDKVPHAVNDGKVFAEISFYGFLQKRLGSRFPQRHFHFR